MAKDKAKNDYSGFSDDEYLQKEFINSSDRAVAILAGSALDAHLEKLLKSFLIKDDKAVDELINSENSNAPLGTFSGKILAAYCLGLISENDFKDLQTIRKIRNIFAHNLKDCDFSNNRIKQFIDNLIFYDTLLKQRPGHEKMNYKTRFVINVYYLDGVIKSKITNCANIHQLPNGKLGKPSSK